MAKLSNLPGRFFVSAMLSTLACGFESFALDSSGLITSQTAYNINSGKFEQQEWQLDWELDAALWGGDLTAISRVRIDTLDDLNQTETPSTFSDIGSPLYTGNLGQLDIREFYWQIFTDNSFWRIGKQQVVWGEADGLRLLDIVNPQDFREFILDDFDDARIPLWMVNSQFNLSDSGVLQILWIPDTTVHNLAPAGSSFSLSSPIFVPNIAMSTNDTSSQIRLSGGEAPESFFGDSDMGIRYSDFVDGWDYTLNYLYHYVDEPVTIRKASETDIVLEQDFHRSHLVGGSASKAFGNWTLRLELAWESNRFHRTDSFEVINANQLGAIMGIDYQGLTDQFLSVQWFQNRIMGSNIELIENKRENIVTSLWQSNFLNETLVFEWQHIHSIDHGDGVAQLSLNCNLSSELDVFIGADLFYGDKEDLFGQFEEQDHITFGFMWGF